MSGYETYLIRCAVKMAAMPTYAQAVQALRSATKSSVKPLSRSATAVGSSAEQYASQLRRIQRQAPGSVSMGQTVAQETERRRRHIALLKSLKLIQRDWRRYLKQPFPLEHHLANPPAIHPAEAAGLAQAL
jgi:hypothetical protein